MYIVMTIAIITPMLPVIISKIILVFFINPPCRLYVGGLVAVWQGAESYAGVDVAGVGNVVKNSIIKNLHPFYSSTVLCNI
jgi:hypothetical protein